MGIVLATDLALAGAVCVATLRRPSRPFPTYVWPGPHFCVLRGGQGSLG